MLNLVWLFATLWTIALQAPLSTGFPRQEYWGELPLPSSGHLSDIGIKPGSPPLQADSLPTEPPFWGWNLKQNLFSFGFSLRSSSHICFSFMLQILNIFANLFALCNPSKNHTGLFPWREVMTLKLNPSVFFSWWISQSTDMGAHPGSCVIGLGFLLFLWRLAFPLFEW